MFTTGFWGVGLEIFKCFWRFCCGFYLTETESETVQLFWVESLLKTATSSVEGDCRTFHSTGILVGKLILGINISVSLFINVDFY